MRIIFFVLLAIVSGLRVEAAPNPSTKDLPAFAQDKSKENQVALLDNLIEVTEKNLEAQKALKQQVQSYLALQNEYMKNPNDKDKTLKMVQEAYYLHEKIKEAHLTQAFSTDFISELIFFSEIANKRGIPKP